MKKSVLFLSKNKDKATVVVNMDKEMFDWCVDGYKKTWQRGKGFLAGDNVAHMNLLGDILRAITEGCEE